MSDEREMESEHIMNPPDRLRGHLVEVGEGWFAFFDNKDSKDNPYPLGIRHDAWEWGLLEAQNYGN